MIDIATKLQGVVEDCAVRQAGAAKQMTNGDFFVRKWGSNKHVIKL